MPIPHRVDFDSPQQLYLSTSMGYLEYSPVRIETNFDGNFLSNPAKPQSNEVRYFFWYVALFQVEPDIKAAGM